MFITFDLLGAINGGWWQLSLNRTTLVVTIENNDIDAPGGKNTWLMTPDKCVLNRY